MEEEKLVINASERGFRKLYQPCAVEKYKKLIVEEKLLENAKNIELDLTSCRLGYPSTPRFVDLFLNHLSKQYGKKTLIIKMGCISYYEWVCLNIIVLEGSFFGVNEKINSVEDLNRIKKLVDDKLKAYHIHMILKLNNCENTCFFYGEKENE